MNFLRLTLGLDAWSRDQNQDDFSAISLTSPANEIAKSYLNVILFDKHWIFIIAKRIIIYIFIS